MPFDRWHYITVGCLFLLGIIGMLLQKFAYKRLATRHHTTFLQLGSPRLMVSSWKSSFHIQRFILCRRYRQLQDNVLTWLFDIMLITRILSIIVFILLLNSLYNLYLNGDLYFLFGH